MFWMRDHCDESEKENESLKKYVKAVDSFMRDKQLYMPKGISCPYVEGNPTVGSMPCLECDSCLHLLYGIGVVCRQVLNAARIDSEKSVKQN